MFCRAGPVWLPGWETEQKRSGCLEVRIAGSKKDPSARVTRTTGSAGQAQSGSLDGRPSKKDPGVWKCGSQDLKKILLSGSLGQRVLQGRPSLALNFSLLNGILHRLQDLLYYLADAETRFRRIKSDLSGFFQYFVHESGPLSIQHCVVAFVSILVTFNDDVVFLKIRIQKISANVML